MEWRNVTFSKVVGLKRTTLIKVILVHVFFPHFLNCTNGTKSPNTSQSWKRNLGVIFCAILQYIIAFLRYC